VLQRLGVAAQLFADDIRTRIAQLRDQPEAGTTTEQVIITALLAVAAIAIVGVIVAKVTARAKSINLGGG
jgi:plasmid stabilization system protein ParE